MCEKNEEGLLKCNGCPTEDKDTEGQHRTIETHLQNGKCESVVIPSKHPEHLPVATRKTTDNISFLNTNGRVNTMAEHTESNITSTTRLEGGHRQNSFETEFMLHRCYSDTTGSGSKFHALFKNPRLKSADKSEISHSLPRTSTSYFRRKIEDIKEVEYIEPQLNSDEASLKPDLLTNAFPGSFPFRTQKNLSKNLSRQRKSPALVGVLKHGSLSETKQTCSLNSLCPRYKLDKLPSFDAHNSVGITLDKRIRDIEGFTNERLFTSNIYEKHNVNVVETTSCCRTESDLTPVDVNRERSKSLPHDQWEDRKRTRGSISKLLNKPKLACGRLDGGKVQSLEREPDVINGHADVGKQEENVLKMKSSKTQEVTEFTASQVNCEFSGCHSDNSCERRVPVFSPPVLLSNNDTCLLHPGCPEDSGDRFVFNPLTYFALANYEADGDMEVSFCEGEEVKLLRKADNGWWLVKVGNEKGWAPSNFLEPGPSNFLRTEPSECVTEGLNDNTNVRSPHVSLDMLEHKEPRESRECFQFEHGSLVGSSNEDTVQVMHRGSEGYSFVRIPSMYGWIPNEQIPVANE